MTLGIPRQIVAPLVAARAFAAWAGVVYAGKVWSR